MLLLLGAGLLSACESPLARAERGRAQAKLARVETALASQLPPRASQAQVQAFLGSLGVATEPHPLPGEMMAYLGEWQGPFFQRGLHLVFYFDSDGALVRYEAKEVEGS